MEIQYLIEYFDLTIYVYNHYSPSKTIFFITILSVVYNFLENTTFTIQGIHTQRIAGAQHLPDMWFLPYRIFYKSPNNKRTVSWPIDKPAIWCERQSTGSEKWNKGRAMVKKKKPLNTTLWFGISIPCTHNDLHHYWKD